ncbi:thioesterase family protein [alpha proteobacterium U9-1i]|nr:thioesterase family protein [alpha proteobacterium U9-1i]
MLTRIKTMMEWTPQGRALGIVLERHEGKKVWARVPYRADLVGDPETGVIAGGVITTSLDQLCGLATVLAMQTPSTVATIDIRIDYMRGAIPGRDVWAEAECIKIGRTVAFVQAIAYEDDASDPIARATATFMVNAQSKRRIGSNLKPPRT